MARRRVETERLLELIRLHRLGVSARGVTRVLRMGGETERRYRRALAAAGLLEGPAEELPGREVVRAAVDRAFPRAGAGTTAVAAWEPRLEELFAKGLSARAAFDRLRLEPRAGEPPFRGSYSAVKRAYRRIRLRQGVLASDVAIPVETAPGEVAQVDVGYAGKLYDPERGVLRRAWVFVLVLGFSRQQVVRLVFDLSVETWLRLHVEAFQELGGSVAVLVPDNTRRAVLRAAFGIDGPCELERSYRELAGHYGVVIAPTPPGAPWKKGKVEAAIKYAKNGYGLKGREGEPFPQVAAALQRWNCEVASLRIHGTTRRQPRELFEDVERAALRPLPAVPYEPAVWKRARVHPDCHLVFRRRLYSAPWRLVGEEVWVRGTACELEVWHDDRVVARHRVTGRWRTTLEEHLPADRRELRHRGRALWEERARKIGPETLGLVEEVFEEDQELSQLRRVQAIVTLLERYPRRRAEAASRWARQAGERSYRGIRRVLIEGVDLLMAASDPRDLGLSPTW